MGMRIFLRQFAAGGERAAPARGDMGVLGHVKRGEAARFERLRQFGDVDAVIGREIEDAYLHVESSADRKRYPLGWQNSDCSTMGESHAGRQRSGASTSITGCWASAGRGLALQPGGRRGLGGVEPLAEKIAEAGNRVLIYDRRNCGASGVSFDGGNSENEIWAEDLRELLLAARRLAGVHRRQLVGVPAGLAAGSAPSGGGARACCCGGSPAAPMRPSGWSQNYYTQFIEMAQSGRHGGGVRTASISAKSSKPIRPTARGSPE